MARSRSIRHAVISWGYRGILHDANRQLGRRSWAHDNWIICYTAFRGRHRTVMSPRRYTELFFLDEAVALAAGHRPCYECRRHDYHAWTEAWRIAYRAAQPPRAKEMDRALHLERIDRATRRQKKWSCHLDDLPDGAFVAWEGAPHLVLGNQLFPWRHSGYTAAIRRPAAEVTVLTPPTSIRTLAAGFRPTLHATARTPKI